MPLDGRRIRPGHAHREAQGGVLGVVSADNSGWWIRVVVATLAYPAR
jgi:hypothetical protein